MLDKRQREWERTGRGRARGRETDGGREGGERERGQQSRPVLDSGRAVIRVRVNSREK